MYFWFKQKDVCMHACLHVCMWQGTYLLFWATPGFTDKKDLDTVGEMNPRSCVNGWWGNWWLNSAPCNCFTVQSLKFLLIQKRLWKKKNTKNRKEKKINRAEAIMQHPLYPQDKNSELPVSSNCNIEYSQQNSWNEKSIIQLEKTMCNY